MKIGGHVSIASGIEKAPERGHAIGANVIQIFGSSPRSFRPSNYSREQFAQFKENAKQYGIFQTFLHGVYLIALASQDKDYRHTSIKSLIQYLTISHEIAGQGVIFHTGSSSGLKFEEILDNVVDSCKQVLKAIPGNQFLIIENSAGMGDSIGSTFEQLSEIYSGVGNDRLRFCLDTQHTFAAGFDLRTKESIDETIEKFERLIGWDKIAAIHCNDSKTELGSGLDRHENIGKGKLGLEAFRIILNHPNFKDLPFITEVPGIDYKSGPDKPNIDLLKSLVKA